MLLYPTYFSPIAHFVALVNAKHIIFETCDNFQKQTYRNRCFIFGPQGKQLLNIPVERANSKQATKDIRIDYDRPWQDQHLKAIATCYNSSPFYEFFDRELAELFAQKETFLLDFNLRCHEFILDALQLELGPIKQTVVYEKEQGAVADYRFLADAKDTKHYGFKPYTQVFSDRHGFIENLSILDLLFAEGGNSANYLESQVFDW